MRIFHNWGYDEGYGGMWSFPLANLWWGNGVFGFSLFGIALEWKTNKMKEGG